VASKEPKSDSPYKTTALKTEEKYRWEKLRGWWRGIGSRIDISERGNIHGLSSVHEKLSTYANSQVVTSTVHRCNITVNSQFRKKER